MGYGYGRGRGFRGEYYPDPVYYDEPYHEPTPEEEKNFLEKAMESLEQELKDVKDRLKKLTEKKE